MQEIHSDGSCRMIVVAGTKSSWISPLFLPSAALRTEISAIRDRAPRGLRTQCRRHRTRIAFRDTAILLTILRQDSGKHEPVSGNAIEQLNDRVFQRELVSPVD